MGVWALERTVYKCKRKLKMHENRYCTILLNLTDHCNQNTVAFQLTWMKYDL